MTRTLRAATLLALGLGAVTAVGTAIATAGAQSMPTATAAIQDPSGKALGTVTLTQYPHAVLVKGELSGLAPGPHGLHIHQNGACTPDFAAAGGHFNPAGAQHGLDAEPHHTGDLANIVADAQGNARFEQITHHVTLGEGANSLFKDGGTAIVVHAGPDDYTSEPAGASGDRVGCGVIRKG